MERTLKIIALFIFLIILCLLPTLVVGSSCDNFTIVVKINIAANFTYQPQHPKPGDAVTFTDTSYPDIAINWTWDFGDGSISYQENPTHTYYYAGTYQVTLTVVNEGGINDTILKNITVSKVTHPSNNPPTADANGPYYRHVGQTITFDGSKSSDLDGTIVSYDWDFGDGNTGVGVTSTHIYSSAGTYTMILTVTDNEGATDSDPTTVTISVPVGFLFDVILELTTDSVFEGEDISALITLINVGESGLVNGTVNYTLSKSGVIIWSKEESVSVLGQKAFNKTILTEELSSGEYTYEVVYSYGDNQTASAQDTFTVKAQPSEEIPLWIIVIIVLILIIIIIIAFLIKAGYIHIG